MGCTASRPPTSPPVDTPIEENVVDDLWSAPATPPRALKTLPPLPPIDTTDLPPDIRDAAAALVASGGLTAARVAARLLHIAAVHPTGRDTRLRLSHPRVHAAILLPVGGLELFEACGYRCEFGAWSPDGTPVPSAAATEAWLVLDGAHADTACLAAGATALRDAAARAAGWASPGSNSHDVGGSNGDDAGERGNSGDVPVTRPRSPVARPCAPVLVSRPRSPVPAFRRHHRVLLPMSSASALDDDVGGAHGARGRGRARFRGHRCGNVYHRVGPRGVPGGAHPGSQVQGG